MLILAVGMCFSGAANSVRELIKERVIYERERATGLSRSAYLMSKVIVLGVITIIQGAIICAIAFTPRKLPAEGLFMPPAVELCISVTALGITAMMFGLVISSLVKTAEKTMPLLVMFAIIQVVFTGILFQLYDKIGLEQFAYLMPSRWSVAAMRHHPEPRQAHGAVGPREPHQHRPAVGRHRFYQWFLDVSVLLLLGVICGVAVARLLRRHEPEVMRK